MQVHATLTSLSNNRPKLKYTECHFKEGHGMRVSRDQLKMNE